MSIKYRKWGILILILSVVTVVSFFLTEGMRSGAKSNKKPPPKLVSDSNKRLPPRVDILQSTGTGKGANADTTMGGYGNGERHLF